jgi:hypothetical protein
MKKLLITLAFGFSLSATAFAQAGEIAANLENSEELTAKHETLARPAVKMLFSPVDNLNNPKLLEGISSITSGEKRSFKTTFTVTKETNVQSTYRVQVVGSFDPRPIGGILTVKTDLLPGFVGIGVATRPIASKSQVESLDDLSTESVQSVLQTLLSQLSEENGSLVAN